MPTTSGDRSVRGRIRRVASDDLVIFVTDDSTEESEDQVTIPDDELVYEPITIATGVAIAGVVVATATLIYNIYKDQRDHSEAKSADQHAPARTEIHVTCSCGTSVDVSSVQPPSSDSGTHAPNTGATPTSTHPSSSESPQTQTNSSTSQTPRASGPNSTEIAAEDFAQPDANQLPINPAQDKLDGIMEDFLTKSFEDAQSAAAYFQTRVKEAAIEVRVTEQGYQAVEAALPDPGRVAQRLRDRGVREKTLIRQAVNETNTALRAMETFFTNLQADFAANGETANSQAERSVANGSVEEAAVVDPFPSLVPRWIGLVPDSFSWQARATGRTSSPGLGSPESTTELGSGSARPGGKRISLIDDVLSTVAPRKLLEIESKTTTGVLIRASIQTSVSVVPETPLEAGIHTLPLKSVFENAPNAWEQKA